MALRDAGKAVFISTHDIFRPGRSPTAWGAGRS